MRKSAYAKEFLQFKQAFDRCYRRRRFREIQIPGMRKGLVSVVLPVYNGERYLEEAIRSVIGQGYTDWELLVVDDGSEDRSPEIAEKYAQKDQRIRVLAMEHKKLPAALNAGFAQAKGEYYTWTSADNRMEPDCLEQQVRFLRRHPKADMTYGNMRLLDENGQILRGKGWYEIPPLSGNVRLPKTTEELNTYANNTIGAAFLYRARIAALAGGYQEQWFTMEDYDYFMRINSIGTICHIPEKKPVYLYRMHKDSLTAQDESLGITARRPQLMALDKRRRAQLIQPVCYHQKGVDRRGVLGYIGKGKSDAVACGVSFDTDELPEGEVKVYIADQSRTLPKGFDLYLSFTEETGCLYAEEPEVIAHFMDVYCRGNCEK